MTRIVEWVGGPYDGQQFEVAEPTVVFPVVRLLKPIVVESATEATEALPSEDIPFQVDTVPLRKLSNGEYRVYWAELTLGPVVYCRHGETPRGCWRAVRFRS